MMRIILIAIICCYLCGCSSIMLSERERALDAAYENGKISKIQYLSSMSVLDRERANNTSGKK
ncbi:MAG: hypothetical protein PHT32_04560 [Candidatus Omnitrophica bacterium]|nr:hypothetical protein [Candidatus Omnitrophota bacterium]